ncbi:MAG: THUMP domain-containing protein [Conexivisphaera sp.]|jgi:tRNA acetyltransferase TAN1|nr:THUMP domain-containing protein [Conexivisphaerales archaeon]
MDEFDLLFTTYRGGERRAASEMARFLRDLGDESADIEITEFPGLLLARTPADPFELIEHLRGIVEEEPWRIRSILRVVPAEITTDASIQSVVQAAKGLASKIGSDETYRVDVEKRGSSLSGRELIDAVASAIDRKVKLESPDWIVMVEIVGDRAGVSILREVDVFSSVKAKRDRGNRANANINAHPADSSP